MKVFTCLFLFFLSLAQVDAGTKPEYYASFDPAKGFKPAQRVLADVFLQLAGSLEEFGSPEPFLRHVLKEQNRVADLYRRRFGKEPAPMRPEYLSPEYVDALAKNWNFLSPKLGLQAYTKDVGNTMRDAILGTRGTGTIIVEILNKHQKRVFDAVGTSGPNDASFAALRGELTSQLELDRKPGPFLRYEMARRDAIAFALGIHGTTLKLYGRVDAALEPDQAEKIKAFVLSVILDVGEMAQAELQTGILEWALGAKSATSR